MKDIIRSAVFITFFITLSSLTEAAESKLYFVDAHSQVDHKVVPLEKIVSLMEQADVNHTILSTRGKLKGKDLLRFSTKYREQITPAVRTKGNPYDTGSPKYYKSLKAQFGSRKYGAIAEVLLYHAKKGNKAPEYVVLPDDKRVLTALEYAINKRWPFIVHIEFGALKGTQKERFMKSLRNMLDEHSEQAFVLTHMGQLQPNQCRRLIENHKNIYFHTGWTNPVAVRSSNQPWINLFRGKNLTPEWRDLFIQYPKRFIFALDNVFTEHWTDLYLKQMGYWKKALNELPIEVAHLIAHGNAERLWRIAPSN